MKRATRRRSRAAEALFDPVVLGCRGEHRQGEQQPGDVALERLVEIGDPQHDDGPVDEVERIADASQPGDRGEAERCRRFRPAADDEQHRAEQQEDGTDDVEFVLQHPRRQQHAGLPPTL